MSSSTASTVRQGEERPVRPQPPLGGLGLSEPPRRGGEGRGARTSGHGRSGTEGRVRWRPRPPGGRTCLPLHARTAPAALRPRPGPADPGLHGERRPAGGPRALRGRDGQAQQGPRHPRPRPGGPGPRRQGAPAEGPEEDERRGAGGPAPREQRPGVAAVPAAVRAAGAQPEGLQRAPDGVLQQPAQADRPDGLPPPGRLPPGGLRPGLCPRGPVRAARRGGGGGKGAGRRGRRGGGPRAGRGGRHAGGWTGYCGRRGRRAGGPRAGAGDDGGPGGGRGGGLGGGRLVVRGQHVLLRSGCGVRRGVRHARADLPAGPVPGAGRPGGPPRTVDLLHGEHGRCPPAGPSGRVEAELPHAQ